MAKFIIMYNIFLEDRVRFKKSDGTYQEGLVQDISQLPDVFVEGFENGEYKRWRQGIDSLELIYSKTDLSGKTSEVKFDSGEGIEFIHGEDFSEHITYDINRKIILK